MPEGYSRFLSPDGLAIFLFHGVVDGFTSDVRNYTAKHLQKDDFAAVLTDLLRHGAPVTFDEIVHIWHSGDRLPPNSFAVSFDDGFANNLNVAAPVLSDVDVPSVFYLTTDFIENNTMSWIDRIEFAIEDVPAGRLALPWGTRSFSDAASKRARLDEIRVQVKSDASFDPASVADDIQQQLLGDLVHSSDDPLNRKLTWSEVRHLGGNPLFTVGGHSHTHPILSFLEPAALACEIDTSLSLLREKGGVDVSHYSYPEGLAHCFNETVIAALRARDIVCCPTAEPGLNDSSTDLFHLKRIPVTGTVPDAALVAEIG